ncbi:hypothetical protein WJX79_010494 [Trebouxia sp. C0005]
MWFAWYMVACLRETLGSLVLQSRIAAACTTKTVASIGQAAPQQVITLREPSFASWTKTDDGELHNVAVCGDATLQQPGSPVKRPTRSSAALQA